MRPNSTAIAKVGPSSRMPGARTAITPGIASIRITAKGRSTSSSAAWAWRAKARASSRPPSWSSRANSGTKAAEKAPSANSRRKKLGNLNATKKASATAPEPSTADSTMSRTKPTTRLSSVKLPTVAMARPRLMGCRSFFSSPISRGRPGGGRPRTSRPPGSDQRASDSSLGDFPLRRCAPPPPWDRGYRIWQFSVVSGGVTPALERSEA